MLLLQGDLKRVMAGVKRVESDLGMLKLDYSPEARVFHQVYLGKILRHTRDLELLLHMVLIHCAMAESQCGKKNRLPAVDGLHRAFFSMNPALRCLQKIEMRARNGNPSIGLFDALDEDWKRFKQAVFKAIKIPRHPCRRNRHLAWTSVNGSNRSRACSLS